jgi:putative tryptophan/tyrosine transport system substrate-binding protein
MNSGSGTDRGRARVDRRRALLALLALGAPPFALLAQAPHRVGLVSWSGSLMDRSSPGGRDFLAAMKELGYAEGRDFVYEERFWQTQDQAPDMVRELVRLKAQVIIAAGPPSIVAAKSVTDRVPIVMMYSAEPVAMGLVRSLNAPGGNITGLTWDHGFETNLKALELLKEVLPKLRRVALLWDASDSVHPVYARTYENVAPRVKVELQSLPVQGMADIEAALERMKKARADALIVLPSGQLTVPRRREILSLAMRARMPTLFAYVGRDAPDALLQFGPHLANMPRRAAAYVDRILKGAKPADIPVEQPDKYDLVVDLVAAGKLGISVPRSVLVRADQVLK